MKEHPQAWWQRVRSGVMLVVGVLTSPCCTVLFVPLVLSLLVGTPAAVWVGQHSGLLYGALTLVSIVSLGMGIYWMRNRGFLKGLLTDE